MDGYNRINWEKVEPKPCETKVRNFALKSRRKSDLLMGSERYLSSLSPTPSPSLPEYAHLPHFHPCTKKNKSDTLDTYLGWGKGMSVIQRKVRATPWRWRWTLDTVLDALSSLNQDCRQTKPKIFYLLKLLNDAVFIFRNFQNKQASRTQINYCAWYCHFPMLIAKQ